MRPHPSFTARRCCVLGQPSGGMTRCGHRWFVAAALTIGEAKEKGQGTLNMSLMKSASALLAGAVISIGALVVGGAMAADLPVKAKPVVVGASAPLDVHGWFDATFASNRVTGGGLLLYPDRGFLTQANIGLGLDVYKDPMGFINLVTIYGGVWNEFWSDPPPGGRVWQEMDWWVGVAVGFAKYFKLSVEHVQFNFPNGIPTAYNYVFTLNYDDSHWGWPIPFNPYVSVFYNARGGSTVVLGKPSDGYRVTVGVVPTLALQKYAGIPLTFTFPTSVTFGPDDFWNRNDGTTNFCGPTGLAPCELNNLGFVTTGIAAKYELPFVPKRLGNWYVKAAGHYYHIFNDALLAAQTPVGTGAVASFATAKSDIFIGTTGVGFSF